jgi:hypothetical protein
MAEECLEVAHRCTKALRFGLGEIEPGQYLPNSDRIVSEYADLQSIAKMLTEAGSLPQHNHLDFAMEAKRAKIERFLQYSKECGTLDAPTAGDAE